MLLPSTKIVILTRYPFYDIMTLHFMLQKEASQSVIKEDFREKVGTHINSCHSKFFKIRIYLHRPPCCCLFRKASVAVHPSRGKHAGNIRKHILIDRQFPFNRRTNAACRHDRASCPIGRNNLSHRHSPACRHYRVFPTAGRNDLSHRHPSPDRHPPAYRYHPADFHDNLQYSAAARSARRNQPVRYYR